MTHNIWFAMERIRDFFKSENNERGASAVEYAILIGLVAVGVAAAVNALMGDVDTAMNTVGTTIRNAANQNGAGPGGGN